MLNVDGASRGNPGDAGGGVVVRDHASKWVRGFSGNFGICSSVKAELLALLYGLRFPKEVLMGIFDEKSGFLLVK